MRNAIILFILFALFPGCQIKSSFLKPPLEEDGEIYLYVRPFPAEAERIRFGLSEIAARRDDGREFPLALAVSDFDTDSMGRQRLVASGLLPPGTYAGLSFRAAAAFLKREEGENVLLVSEERLLAGLAFEIRKGRAAVIEGAFRPADAVRGRFGFSPSFALFHPEQPVAALTGYVANYGSNNVTVFDKKSGQVVNVIATGTGPRGIALDQDLRRAYVALAGDDAVDVIDVSADEIIHRIRLATGDRPQEPAVTNDGRLLMTANKGSDTVSIIDPISFIETDRISVGKGPNAVLIDEAGRRAYVFNTLADTISVIDLAVREVSATISTDAGPLRGALNPKGDRLYVIHSLSSYLTVVNTADLSLVQRLSVGAGASAIRIEGRTGRIFIGKQRDFRISVYEPQWETPTDTIQAGGGVSSMAIDSEENTLYLVLPRKKILTRINIVSDETDAELDVGDDAYWVTLMGER